MADFDEPADQDLEEIVAYLDGELSSEASARVERRLASDEDFRQELQSVERAWSVLDELPMATVDDRFSRTTMSLVVEAAAEEVQSRTRALPIQRRRRWVSTVLGATAAAALGFLAFRLAWHDPNAMLLADLPVIENIDIYSQFNDVAFLRELQKVAGELEHLNGDALDVDVREVRFAEVAEPEQGGEWLLALNDDERSTLRAKYNRFRELPEREQQRLRDLHREIMAAKDSSSLVRTMLAYQQWLGGLPPVRQFELRDEDDVERRVAKIRQWTEYMRANEALTLTDAELLAFFDNLQDHIVALRAKFRRSNRGDEHDRLKDIASGEMAGRWRGVLVEQFDDYRGQSSRFYRAVVKALPERTRDAFASLPPIEKVNRFTTWVRQHTACRGEVTQDELEEFFREKLDLKVQAQLLSLPPGEMEQALRRMYRCEPQSGPFSAWPLSQLASPPFGPAGVSVDRPNSERPNGERPSLEREREERRNNERRDNERRDSDRGGDSRDRDDRDRDERGGDRDGQRRGQDRPGDGRQEDGRQGDGRQGDGRPGDGRQGDGRQGDGGPGRGDRRGGPGLDPSDRPPPDDSR